MDQRQTCAQKNRVHTAWYTSHFKDCSRQLRWWLTCRQHQLDEQPFYHLLATSTEQVVRGCQDVQKAATAAASLCRPSLTHRSISEWSSAKALDPNGNLGQGWNQRHASKTERQNNQGQKAVVHCFGSRLWLGRPSDSLSGTRPDTSQPCFPTAEAATGSITPALCHKEPRRIGWVQLMLCTTKKTLTLYCSFSSLLTRQC